MQPPRTSLPTDCRGDTCQDSCVHGPCMERPSPEGSHCLSALRLLLRLLSLQKASPHAAGNSLTAPAVNCASACPLLHLVVCSLTASSGRAELLLLPELLLQTISPRLFWEIKIKQKPGLCGSYYLTVPCSSQLPPSAPHHRALAHTASHSPLPAILLGNCHLHTDAPPDTLTPQ